MDFSALVVFPDALATAFTFTFVTIRLIVTGAEYSLLAVQLFVVQWMVSAPLAVMVMLVGKTTNAGPAGEKDGVVEYSIDEEDEGDDPLMS